jgi:pyruvate, orthophosphate dikinase
VRANADTVKDAERARRFGGEGVGLCRTEHMFLGERRQRVERLILAEDDEARAQAMEALLPLQRWDFLQILTAMDGLPPAAGATASRVPAHITEPSVRVALAEARGKNENDLRLMQAVHSLTSRTRCSGCAGCASASSCPACSTCRSERSRRPPRS